MGNLFSSGKPDKGDYEPMALDQDLKARYLGIIDKYMADKNMTSYIPQENRPYEIRSPQERGEWRNATGNQVNSQGAIQQPSLNNGVFFNSQPNAPVNLSGQAQFQNATTPGSTFKDAPAPTERQVSSQAIAPATSAPQMNQVPLTSNTAFFQEDQRRKQAEYNKVKDYVYRDNRSR